MPNAKKVITPPARMSFPYLFKPRINNYGKGKTDGDPEFSVTLLFPPGADLSALEALVKEAAMAKWNGNIPKNPLPNNPIRDQGEKVRKDSEGNDLLDETGRPILQDGYVAGAKFINAKTYRRPGVVDAQVQPIIDESEIYSGAWCVCSVSAYVYDWPGNRGVKINLINLQKIKDDEALGGRSTPQEDFKPIAIANGSADFASAKATADNIFG